MGNEPFEFYLTPRDITAHFDEHMIGQDAAKRTLATAVSVHYRSLAAPHAGGKRTKPNVLLVGPTGSGKTFLCELATEYAGIDFVEFDASHLTQSGYVGDDVRDIIAAVLQVCELDTKRAERSLIYIDEIDKIARNPGLVGKDIHGDGVQHELLKLIEGTDFYLQSRHGHALTVDTRGMLFVLSGTFTGIDEIQRKRLNATMIGFGARIGKGTEALGTPTVDDLVSYGMDRQFMGRIPLVAGLEKLSTEQLHAILRLGSSKPLRALQEWYEAEGITLEFPETAAHHVAELAGAHDIGARGLEKVLYDTLLDCLYELSGTGVSQLTITPELFDEPKETLSRLIASSSPPRPHAVPCPVSGHSPFDERQYLAALEALHIDREILRDATTYGRKHRITPELIPEVLLSMEISIRMYEQIFAQLYNKKISFGEFATRSLIKNALARGQKVDAFINIRVAPVLESETFLDHVPDCITIDVGVHELPRFVERLGKPS